MRDTIKTVAALLLLTVAVGGTPAFATPESFTVTETVDFDGYDRKATGVARAMYGKQFSHIEGKSVWLIDPDEASPQQVVFKMGPPNCEPDCQVGVLYYVGDTWLEIWRGPGKSIQLGEVNPDTGLRDIWDGERVWVWDGQAYMPLPRGDFPQIRELTDEEADNAKAYVREQYGLNPDAPLNVMSAFNIDLKDGKGTAVRINTPAVCEGISGACPVVFIDGDDVPMGMVRAINGDVRPATSKDVSGYNRIEAQLTDGVAVISPKLGKEDSGSYLIQKQPVTRAGDVREEERRS